MMERFQLEMKQIYRIHPSMVEKYKDEICFMVETNTTCMEAMEPRVNFIEPMGYEMSEEIIEGYTKIILYSKRDIECQIWGTHEEKIREVRSKLHSKEIKNNVEKKIEFILKESA